MDLDLTPTSISLVVQDIPEVDEGQLPVRLMSK